MRVNARALLSATAFMLVLVIPSAAWAQHKHTLGVSGFIVGLLVVSIGWGLFSLIMASIYNSLAKNAALSDEARKLNLVGQRTTASVTR